MKLFTNLPGSLRFLFSVLRALTVFIAMVWSLMMLTGLLSGSGRRDGSKLMVALGEVIFRNDPAVVTLVPDQGKAGAIEVSSWQGSLKLDLFSKDAQLVSAIRWTLLPSMAVILVFTWLLFTALRNICANIEKGEVFSEKNLRLVRSVGVILIGGSVAAALTRFWASWVMDAYLNQHVTLQGTQTGQPIMGLAGVLHFNLPSELFSTSSGLITGLLVLVIAEAFRQGLNLKNENDLTV